MHINKGRNRRQLGELAIAVLGMVEGLRLLPEGWIHFYRAAINPHTLCDLVCSKVEIEHILEKTEEFWQCYPDAEIRRNLFGSIHWYVFSQSYDHEFEEFGAQCMVLNSSFKLLQRLGGHSAGKQTFHSQRPSTLAKAFRIPMPPWGRVRNRECPLSRLRNAYFHEGLYGGRPIGFGHPRFHQSITLQLKAFNLRIILGLLGVRCAYVRSPVSTRQMYGLDLFP